MADRRSRSGAIALRIAGLGGLLALGGVALIQASLIPPMAGFLLFAAGTLLGGFAAILFGAWGVFKSRDDFDGDRRRQSVLALLSGVGLVAVVVVAGSAGRGLPRINDITTDLADPPSFMDSTAAADPAGRDMSYPQEFAPLVRAAYGDLAPLAVKSTPTEAFAHALATARSLGWEITHQDPTLGVFDATDTTRIFRFVDDVTVRVRPAEDGARIDVRSKSRDGRGDLGANAARIRAFDGALRAGSVAAQR